VLTCIANLSNDEVFTPPEFANRMLDTLAEAWAADYGGANSRAPWDRPNSRTVISLIGCWPYGGQEMPGKIPNEERLTEDEIARRKLGPRGVPGGEDSAKMTPQQRKNLPNEGEFDGHVA
jgi:hypothetical protein